MGVDIRHNFLFETRNIWRPGPIEHFALPQDRAWVRVTNITKLNFLLPPCNLL